MSNLDVNDVDLGYDLKYFYYYTVVYFLLDNELDHVEIFI